MQAPMKFMFFKYWGKDFRLTENHLSFSIPFSSKTMNFMPDHFFRGKCLIPAAMLIEAAVEACVLFLGDEDIWPLCIESFTILRGIHVPIGVEYTIKTTIRIKNFSAGKSSFQIEFRGNKSDSKGKVIRKNILFACGNITMKMVPVAWDILSIGHASSRQVSMPQKIFYDNFVKTHSTRFQTFTGNMHVAIDRSCVQAEYFIGEKEKNFSKVQGLWFILSPLDLDSIFQAAVFLSVLSDPGESAFVFTKIPITIDNFYLLYPPNNHGKNYCTAVGVEHSEEKMVLSAHTCDGSGKTVGFMEKLILKKAAFTKFKRGEPFNILKKYTKNICC